MTLKQIIARLSDLAANHRQINHFFLGGADEFLDDEDVQYPALFVTLNNNASISLDERLCTYNFTLYFFELLNIADKSLVNQWEATSDMASVAQDYLALLLDVEYKDWDVNTDFNLEVKEYQLQDLACGVSVDVQISSRFDANKCQVPATYTYTDDVSGELTLKQILTRCENLALSHDQVNSYVLGRFDRFLDGSDVIYPAVFAEFGRTGTISLSQRLATYRFTFHFFDLLDIADNSLNNEFEVKSDMMQVAQDYLAMLGYYGFRWVIGSEHSVTIQDYQLQDLTAGVSVTVDISSYFDANKCQVPTLDELGDFIIWNDYDKILVDDTNKLLYD
jgi:hypothetical protein